MIKHHRYPKAIGNNGKPRIINIDKSGANYEGISTINKRRFTRIKIRSCKYLNNIVEQDHRNIKCRLCIGTGFKKLESSQRTLAGIEAINIIRKNQIIAGHTMPYKTFCSLAA